MAVSKKQLCTKFYFFLEEDFEVEDLEEEEEEDLVLGFLGGALVSFRGGGLSRSRPCFMASTALQTFR